MTSPRPAQPKPVATRPKRERDEGLRRLLADLRVVVRCWCLKETRHESGLCWQHRSAEPKPARRAGKEQA